MCDSLCRNVKIGIYRNDVLGVEGCRVIRPEFRVEGMIKGNGCDTAEDEEWVIGAIQDVDAAGNQGPWRHLQRITGGLSQLRRQRSGHGTTR